MSSMDEDGASGSASAAGVGGASSSKSQWFSGKGELELEVPFVEKYRPILVRELAMKLKCRFFSFNAFCSCKTLWVTRRLWSV